MEEEEQIDVQRRELDTAWDWKPQGFLFCLLHWSLVFTPHPDSEVSPLLTQGCVTACQVATVPGDWRPYRPVREAVLSQALSSDFQCSPCILDTQGQSAARMKQLPVLSQQESGSEPCPAEPGWEAWETQQSERKSALSRAAFLGLQFLMHPALFFFFFLVISTPGATFGRVEREVFYLQKNQFVQQIERDSVSHYQSKQSSTGLRLPLFAEPINCFLNDRRVKWIFLFITLMRDIGF